MADHPNIGVRIKLSDVGIEVNGCSVVAVLSLDCLNKTSLVAGVCTGRAVTYLAPEVLTSLATAAAEEEVVIELVSRGRAVSIKDSWRCALQANNDGLVVLVRKDVASQSVSFPTKALRLVEALCDIGPFSLVVICHISIGSHHSKIDDGILVCHIRGGHLVDGPVGGPENGGLASEPGIG